MPTAMNPTTTTMTTVNVTSATLSHIGMARSTARTMRMIPTTIVGTVSHISSLSIRLSRCSISRLMAKRFSSTLLSYDSVMILSPDRSSFTLICRSAHSSSMIPESGMDLPVSHFDTARSLMPSLSARLACVMCPSFLQDAMNFPILI